MNKIKFLTFITALGISSSAYAMKPITIVDQGSFMAGGKTITAPGKYDGSKPTDFAGETLHGDHAYVFYQKPVNAKKHCLVFLHGYGQSGKSWETTPDGRDGFQNIFLEKGFPTYVVDQPRRGKAGQSTVPHQLRAMPDDQLWYNTFRIGEWPNIYDNVQVPRDEESLKQFFHQMTPDTGAFDQEVISDAMSAVFEKAGDGVIITHSAGGGPGWHTALKSDKVKGIISLEPGAFPFPEGEVPEAEKTSSPFPAVGESMKMEDFMKLTKIPIVVYFGDNIPSEPTDNFGKDNWRVRLNLARKWEKVVNKYGGDCSVVYLPDIGIKGNTHFLMADLNNKEVADVMEKWLIEKGLMVSNENNSDKIAKAPIDEITFTPVVFDNEDSGLKLSGIVFAPKNMKKTDKLPAVVVQGPMGATKEQTQSLYAQSIASKGYITLVYDYSYIGASQGEPRGYEDPEVKKSDIKSAISFISNYPNVDAKRLGAVGICGSGVYLLYEALNENRLKAVASVNPFTVIDTVPYDAEKVANDKNVYNRDGVVTRIDLIEEGSEGAEYYFNYKRGAAVNRVVFPTWSQPTWAAFHPTELAKNMKLPYLMIVGEKAFTRPGAEAMFNNVSSKDKKLVVIPNARHFDMYDKEAYAVPAIEAILEYFKNKL